MKKYLLILFVLTFISAEIFAIDHFMIEVESGVTWLHNEAYRGTDPGDNDPDPILYRIGAAFPIYFNDSLFMRPSLTIISKSWEYISLNEWAMPVDPMWQDLMVMSLLLDIPFGYEFKMNSFSFGLFLGPALNLRIPLWGEEESVRKDMAGYFYREARFLNLAGGLFFNIPLSEIISLTVKGDTWFPLYNIWSTSGLPLSDGLMVTLSAGVRFTF